MKTESGNPPSRLSHFSSVLGGILLGGVFLLLISACGSVHRPVVIEAPQESWAQVEIHKSSLLIGDWVRVTTTSGETHVGEIRDMDAESVSLDIMIGAGITRYPLRQVFLWDELKLVERGRVENGLNNGIGFLGGVALAALVAFAIIGAALTSMGSFM